jgi:hypothetical protein
MTFMYWSGFSSRTFTIAAAPWSMKSSCSASMNASPSLLREPFGRPAGFPLFPGLNCHGFCCSPVESVIALVFGGERASDLAREEL